eukprot:2356617-Pleurochrysis_carterae.AAC.1
MQAALTSDAAFLCFTESRRRRVRYSRYFHRILYQNEEAKCARGCATTDDDATHIHHRERALGKVNDLIRHVVPIKRMLLDGKEKSLGAAFDVVGNVQPLTYEQTDVLLRACDSIIDDRRRIQSPIVEYERIIWPLTDVH